MPIQLIDNFELSVPKPIDNRIVVGLSFSYTDRNSIPLPYIGMRIYDTTDSYPYVYTGSTWSFETQRVDVLHNTTGTSDHFVSFVSATGSPQRIQANQGFKFNPSRGQIVAPTGSLQYPAYSIVGSTTTNFMGMYKSSAQSLGFSVNNAKYFEISPQTTTASSRFKISANAVSGAANLGEGTLGIGYISTATNFEFFPYNNSSAFRIYNVSPLAIVPGWSNNTSQTTAIDFTNWQNFSSMSVRDTHYINTESRRGIISIGSAGNNDQFMFFMNAHTTSNSPFDYDGGGLIVQRNLTVSGASRLSATVSALGNMNVSGKVGIGTTNPLYKLNVQGIIQSRTATSSVSMAGKVLGIGTTTWTGDVHLVTGQVGTTNNSFIQCFSGDVSYNGSALINGTPTLSPYTLEIQPVGGNALFGDNSITQFGGTVSMLGRVGIGAYPTTPAFSNNLNHVLKVVGFGSTGSMLLTTNTWTSGASSSLYFGDNNHYISITYGGEFKLSSSSSMRIISGGTTRMFISSSGNVGVNTSSPSYKLDVSGSSRFDTIRLVSPGFSSNPALRFDTINTGIYLGSSNSLGLSSVGVTTMRITNSEIFVRVHNLGGDGDISAQALSSGTYVPTFTAISGGNVGSYNQAFASWLRAGNVVNVSGRIVVSLTLANTMTQFMINLPTINDLYDTDGTNTVDYTNRLNGVASVDDNVSNNPHVSGYITGTQSDRAIINFKSTSLSTNTVYFTFQYSVESAATDLEIAFGGGETPAPPFPLVGSE